MEIRTLESVSLLSIAEAFNSAFSDYSIAIHYSDEDFENKVIAENIDLKYSPAAFIDGRIAGFILHGLDEIDGQLHIFNAGTGVIPQHRGKRIVEQLYNHILPMLAAKGYRHHQLEVLENNDKAEKIYTKTGFTRKRKVTSFKGNVSNIQSGIKIEEAESMDWDKAETFWNIEPTWQNNTQCIKRTLSRHKIFTAAIDNEFAGYAIVDRVSGRLKQFAVKQEYRRRGIGKALFSYTANEKGEVSFINFDESDTESTAFFKALGLVPFIVLYEMVFVHP